MMKPNRSTPRRPDARRVSLPPKVIGRPRDARIDTEVVEAVLNALERGGYRAVTIDGIAKKVGRPRSSLYRRWPSKRHLVAYAVVSELGENPAADTGTLRGDLLSAVRTTVARIPWAVGSRACRPRRRHGAGRGSRLEHSTTSLGSATPIHAGGDRTRAAPGARRAMTWMWNCSWTCSRALFTFGRSFGHASMSLRTQSRLLTASCA